MFKPLKSRRTGAVIAAAAVALGLFATVGGTSSPAGADPKQYDAFVGMGSNTIQDVVNAYAGESNGTLYTPLKDASSGKQAVSFDAINPVDATSTCIVPKLGSPAVLRPNGSGAGLKALSNSDNGNPGGYGSAACGTKSYAGLIDFSRSSDGPSAATPDKLRYIPMGRDYVGIAVYTVGGGAVPKTNFTPAELNQLYSNTTGKVTFGTTDVYPCAIQANSGTWKFWLKTFSPAITEATVTPATATCNAVKSQNTVAGSGGRVEENDALAFKSKGDTTGAANNALPVGAEIVVPFSASSFVARANGVAPNPNGAFPTAIHLGTISGDSPVNGTSAPYTADPVSYGNAVNGRDVYIVIPTSVITDPGFTDLKALFVDTDPSATNNAAMCSGAANTTKQLFGFTLNTAVPCGDATTKTGPYVTGNS